MRATAQAVPFVEIDMQDTFAHKMGRVELLSDGMVRLWWVVEESSRYVLVGRLLVPVTGVIENRDLIEQALTGKAVLRTFEGLEAVH